MTETVGTITLTVDARPVEKATKSLKDFELAGRGAEQSTTKLNTATDGLAYSANKATKATDGLGTSAESAAKATTGLGNSANNTSKANSGLSSATTVLSNSVKVLASSFAAFKLLDYAKEAAMLSARYDSLGVVMGVVGKNAGYTAQQMEETAQALQKTGITMIGSREQVLKLVQSHIDLAHATKLARIAQDAAYIANVNSTEAFDRMLHGIRSGQTENLRTLGLNVTLENSYKKYAQALGVTTEALDQEQKVQAVLNAVMKEGDTIANTYTTALGTTSKMLASTERLTENLKVKLGDLFDEASFTGVSSYTDLLKELDKQMDAMAASGELKDWARRIAIEFAFLLDITRVFIKQIDILFTMTAAGFSSIKSGDFSGLTKAFMNADEALKALYQDGTKYQDQVNKRIISESMLTDRVTGTSNSLQASSKALEKVNAALQTGTKRTKEYNVEVYKLKEIQQQLANAREIEYQKLKRHESVLDEARSLTDSVKTAQERYNDTLKRYNELRPHISAETYARALKKAEEELSRTTTANTQFHDTWRTSWQNMEQTGRHAFTQFAAHGKDSIDSIGYALKLSLFDLLYQLTARQWIIRLGTSLEGTLSGVFGGAGAKAGTGTSMLNIASGANLLRSGFGSTGLLSSAGRMLPGAAGSFFAGMGGVGSAAASSGIFSAAGGAGTAFIGGAGTAIGGTGMGAAAGMGASFAAFAGPMLAAAAVDFGLRALFGNKSIGGTAGKVLNYVPIIGTLINGLFGRGPLKQKETTLSGAIGMEGFESGMLETRFKAKGGLFRSNKTDFTRIDAITGEIWTDNQKQLGEFAKEMGRASKEIFEAFNEAAKQSSKILTDTSKDLGLSTESLKDFNYQLKLVSEKGKGLTEEQIAEEIGKMSDAMAEKLIPNIADLAKTSETLIAAVGRLHTEFLAAENAVRILGGSLEASREYVRGMGFELSTEFMDAAGGVESFNQKMAFVSENFLTAEQRFKMSTESLNDQLNKLGVPLNTTKEQFYQLLQAAGAAGDAIKLGGLLDVAPLFVEIKNATETMVNGMVAQTGNIISAAENTLVSVWAAEENRLKTLVQQFKDISASLKTFKNGLLLGAASTLDPARKYDFARSQFMTISAQARLGNVDAAMQLQGVADAFLQASQGYYASSGQYEIDFQSVLDAVTNTADVADRQETLLQRQLDTGLDQIRVLLDIKTEVITLADAINQLEIARSSIFNAGNKAGASFDYTTSSVIAPSGANLGNVMALREEGLAQIAAGNALGVYNYAKDKGLTLSDANTILGYAPGTAEKWATENKLPKFDRGANSIPRDMLAMVHKGEEVRPFKQVEADRAAQQEIIGELRALVKLQAAANQRLIEKLEGIEKNSSDTARLQRRDAA